MSGFDSSGADWPGSGWELPGAEEEAPDPEEVLPVRAAGPSAPTDQVSLMDLGGEAVLKKLRMTDVNLLSGAPRPPRPAPDSSSSKISLARRTTRSGTPASLATSTP